WSLTKYGETITEIEAKQIPKKVKKADIERSKSNVEFLDSKESQNSDNAHNEKDWKEELLEILQAIEPDGFERLCQRLLRESGFVKVEVTGRSGDGGIDG